MEGVRILLTLGLVAVCGPRTGLAANFDFFVFSQQWAGGICATTDCAFTPPPSNIWTIHGLWPSNGTGSQPSECNANCNFDMNQLKAIEKNMSMQWPSFFHENEDFWSHEWCKHGTCAEGVDKIVDELSYFSSVLQLNDNVNLFGLLKRYGFGPGENTCFTYTNFTSTVNKLFNQTATFSCAWDPESKTSYIAEIGVCISKDLQKFNCNPPHPEAPWKQTDKLTAGGSLGGDVHLSPCRPSELMCYAPAYTGAGRNK